MNLACSPQVRKELLPPCFYEWTSPVLYWLFVSACHAKKWLKFTRKPKVWRNRKSTKFLTRPLSVLSLSRKNVHNHCCCPISAVTLTTSKLEAILKIYRCSYKIVLGRVVRGGVQGEKGRESEAGDQMTPLIRFEEGGVGANS